MEEIIFTIDISRSGTQLDNDYTFYSDGSIQHCFDQSAYKLNQEKWIKASDISESDKEKIFNRCTEEQRTILRDKFNLQ